MDAKASLREESPHGIAFVSQSSQMSDGVFLVSGIHVACHKPPLDCER